MMPITGHLKKDLFLEYVKAIPGPTVGEDEGLKLQVKELKTNVDLHKEKSEVVDIERAKIEKRIEEEVRRQVAEIFRTVDPSKLRPATNPDIKIV